jgi:hypothetical protein
MCTIRCTEVYAHTQTQNTEFRFFLGHLYFRRCCTLDPESHAYKNKAQTETHALQDHLLTFKRIDWGTKNMRLLTTNVCFGKDKELKGRVAFILRLLLLHRCRRLLNLLLNHLRRSRALHFYSFLLHGHGRGLGLGLGLGFHLGFNLEELRSLLHLPVRFNRMYLRCEKGRRAVCFGAGSNGKERVILR